MNYYRLRTTQADWPEALAFGVMLGALTTYGDGHYHAPGGGLIDLGTLTEPTDEFVEIEGQQVEQRAPILAPDGQPYHHADLVTPVDLAEAAKALPNYAEIMASLGRWFLLDENGKPRHPKNPQHVVAGFSAE